LACSMKSAMSGIGAPMLNKWVHNVFLIVWMHGRLIDGGALAKALAISLWMLPALFECLLS